MFKRLDIIFKLFHTIKHLRFKQVYYRVYYRLIKPKRVECSLPYRASWQWQGPLLNKQSILSKTEVVFLNEKGSVLCVDDWNSASKSKLWLYNLHYFDDLSSTDSKFRFQLHHHFIDKWIDDNSSCQGNGWESYTISLRLVNWVKWCSLQREVPSKYLKSMLEQACVLSRRLEYHILGNHLFANAKALIFVGAYLQGDNGERLLSIGLELLNKELGEQFLNDGAHFELSPMYHSILLWDLLELIDLANTSKQDELAECLSRWGKIAENALFWLSSMVHNDGELSFFNDAAFGIAKSPNQIFAYAQSLGLNYYKVKEPLMINESSGYSRITFEDYMAIFDHANVGPDYLPGHSHADTLSFELSIGNQRVFVNSGTSLYGTSIERLRQRQTAAHNTVTLAGKDSSQVWSGFRVAKRAYAQLEKASSSGGEVQLVASHNGYTQQSPKAMHTRTLDFNSDSLIINDTLSKKVPGCFHLHLHPEVDVTKLSEFELKIMHGDEFLCVFSSSEPLVIKAGSWHPEFGKEISNKKIEIAFTGGQLTTEIKQMKRNS